MSERNGIAKSRDFLLACVAVLVGLCAALLLLEVLLRFLPVNSGLRMHAVSAAQPILHFEPNRNYVFSRGWDFSIVNTGHVNNFGFVNDEDYVPESHTPLIAVIGDSFIEAVMVPFPETVQGRLSAAVRAKGVGRVYSFGSSGSPLSQYLAYATFARDNFQPDGLVIAVISNDFDESLLKYKNDPGFHYFAESAEGELSLTRVDYEPSLLRRVSRYSALARYVATNMYLLESWGRVAREAGKSAASKYVGNVEAHVDPLRLRDSEHTVIAFLDRLPEGAGLPASRILFLVDGIRPNLYSDDGLQEARGSYFDHMRQYFIDQAKRRGYLTEDLQIRFIARHRADGSRFEFATDGHWNGTGHAVAAEAVMESELFRTVFGDLAGTAARHYERDSQSSRAMMSATTR